MRRYRPTIIPILALLPLVLSCVAPTPTPLPPPPTPAPVQATAAPTVMPKFQDPVTLVLWHTEPEGTPAATLLTDLAARFQRECPWITVEPVYVGNYEDLRRKVLAAVRAGNPPDLATAQPPHIAEFMKAGAVVPLDPYIADPELGLSDEDRLDIYPGFWEAARYLEFGGQMLSMPYAMNALALYYNLTALKQAGYEGPPETWEAFEDACRDVTGDGIVGYAAVESATTFTGWLYSRGATLLADGERRAAFAGAEGVEALDLVGRLVAAGAATRPAGAHGDREMFTAGRAAFTMDSTSGLPAYAAAMEAAGQSFEWGCTLIPQAETGRARTVLYGPGLCLFKTEEARQQAAWRFVRWFLESGQAARWTMELGYAPPRESAVDTLAALGWLDERPITRQVLETVIPRALPEPSTESQVAVARLVEDAWLAVAGEVKPAQQALTEAAAQADDILITGG